MHLTSAVSRGLRHFAKPACIYQYSASIRIMLRVIILSLPSRSIPPGDSSLSPIRRNHKARLDMGGFGVQESRPAIGALRSQRRPTVPLDKKLSFNQSHHHSQAQFSFHNLGHLFQIILRYYSQYYRNSLSVRLHH